MSAHVLWGNVASSLSGAGRVLDPARPRSRPALLGLLGGLLAREPLAGTGRLLRLEQDRPDTEWGFRRRSCCLYYRIPGGGTCGDCVLTGQSSRTSAIVTRTVAGSPAVARSSSATARRTAAARSRQRYPSRVSSVTLTSAAPSCTAATTPSLRRSGGTGRGRGPAAGDPQQRLLQVRSQRDDAGHPARRAGGDAGHRPVADVEPDRRAAAHDSSHTSTTAMSTRATGTPNARSPVEIII